jgi:adenylylsulfate kinase
MIESNLTKPTKIIWIIGFPNSGKSMLAEALQELLQSKNIPCVLLDGDQVRKVLSMENHAYARKERIENALRIARLAKLIQSQGVWTIVAANTFFEEIHVYNRENLPEYFEIYLASTESVRRQRDGQKLLYSKYDSGEISQIIGLDIPADIPKSPDLHLDNSLDQTLENLVSQITEAIF